MFFSHWHVCVSSLLVISCFTLKVLYVPCVIFISCLAFPVSLILFACWWLLFFMLPPVSCGVISPPFMLSPFFCLCWFAVLSCAVLFTILCDFLCFWISVSLSFRLSLYLTFFYQPLKLPFCYFVLHLGPHICTAPVVAGLLY